MSNGFLSLNQIDFFFKTSLSSEIIFFFLNLILISLKGQLIMWAKPATGDLDYSPPAVVLVAELIKCSTSISVFTYQNGGIRKIFK